jgi:hypothetical protein
MVAGSEAAARVVVMEAVVRAAAKAEVARAAARAAVVTVLRWRSCGGGGAH